MRIKKFTARTFTEALAQVKKEMSEHAVILSTEEKKGLRPHVEVTAGIEFDVELQAPARGQAAGVGSGLERPLAADFSAPAPYDRTSSRLAAYGSPAAADDAPPSSGRAVDELKRELNGLKAMIEGMKSGGFELSLPPKKRAVVNYLRERAVRDEFALRLSDKAESVEDITRHLSADLDVKRHTGTRKAVMIIGPTGVGKTTTIAKLAAHAVRSGKKAAIINLDTYRIGAVEQIRIYARILGIPLAVAANLEELKTGLRKFAVDRDVIFIDTMGRNPRDEAYIREIAEASKADVPLELHLLMGANSDDECMMEAYRSYRSLPIDYLGFTKVDEAVRYGSLYNLMLTYRKPVAYITTGQQVPADIEFPTVGRLASLIIHKECAA